MRLAAVRGCVVALLCAGCTRGSVDSQDTRTYKGVALAPNVTCSTPTAGSEYCAAYNVRPYVRLRTQYGIACLGNVPPGTTPNPIPPPLSYLAKDVGKATAPELTSGEAAELGRIERFVSLKTLRFAWINRENGHQGFIVFDATDGPCALDHYEVLNGGCNVYYMPGENPYTDFAGTPGNWPCKRPWGFANS